MHDPIYQLCLTTTILALVGTTGAAVIHVPADHPTIQQGIDAATDGDIVAVSVGTYFERLDFHGKAVSLQSESGPKRTIIDGGNVGAVIALRGGEGRHSKMIGFCIQNGHASFGASITLLSASPTIMQNIFRDNAQSPGGFGAAIGGNSSSPIIENNIFVENTCDNQVFSGVVSFVNSSSPLIIDNIFSSNPCRAVNMSLLAESAPVVANNTIVGNRVGVRVEAGFPTSSQLYANNIIVQNGMGLEVDYLKPDNEPTWVNNLVFGNRSGDYFGIADLTGSSGNISVDPEFVGPGARRLQLTPGSPAIDTGTLDVPDLPLTDLARNPRVLDGDGNGEALPDMGAFEFVP